jgi:hypothetical protein
MKRELFAVAEISCELGATLEQNAGCRHRLKKFPGRVD